MAEQPPAAPTPPVKEIAAMAIRPTASMTQPAVLNRAEMKLQFGWMNSTRRRVQIHVDPGVLTRVATNEYQILSNTMGAVLQPEITEEQYVRMIRTLTYKRLTDIVEFQTGVRPAGALQMARHFDVPAPSSELLYALGPYKCDLNGRVYHTYPIAIPAPVPQWAQLDQNIIASYRLFMDQVKGRYQLNPFPKPTECDGQPLMFTVGQEANGLKQIRAALNVPNPSDGFLRFVHEEFYTDVVPVFNNCDLIMTEQLFVDDVVDAYVKSYVTSVHM